MRINKTEILLLAAFVLVAAVFYLVSFGAEETDRIFITISTFFFSIFTGFFISRQGSRYSKLRETISTFDGKLSSIYRAAQNVSPEVQKQTGDVIRTHYERTLHDRSWEHHFSDESVIISSIHQVLEDQVGSNKQESLRNQAVGRMLAGLSDAQVLRKNMVMLYQERIPSFQWFLIIFFLVMLLMSISVIPSVGEFLGSILKAAFVISLISVVIILRSLDNLHLFEGFIGENSAKDVLANIK
ncbi:MAG TPA: hypothetical protein VEA36_03320 [Candidatus Paceibacterota bacterium]|nr:hypothetical protein [Candidatus Paceibacterota bacterium]